jgi:hypothetical protein
VVEAAIETKVLSSAHLINVRDPGIMVGHLARMTPKLLVSHLGLDPDTLGLLPTALFGLQKIG